MTATPEASPRGNRGSRGRGQRHRGQRRNPARTEGSTQVNPNSTVIENPPSHGHHRGRHGRQGRYIKSGRGKHHAEDCNEGPQMEVQNASTKGAMVKANRSGRHRNRASNKPKVTTPALSRVQKIVSKPSERIESNTPAAEAAYGQTASSKPCPTAAPNSQQHQGNRPSPKRPVTTFLHLPTELRWQIYRHVFVTRRVEVLRQCNKAGIHTRPRYRLYSRQLRPRSPGNQIAPTAGVCVLTPLPIGLVLSCRTVYRETVLQLYAQTQFVFNTTKTVSRFLRTTTRDTQACITHIELNHVMYNEPRLTEFRYFKLRSDMAWYLACEEMALRLSGLRVLHVWLTVHDWPIRLVVGERWSLPLLFFGRDGGLDYAAVKLRVGMFAEEKVREAERGLEERIMGPRRWEIREDERLARELTGPVKTRVLRLVI